MWIPRIVLVLIAMTLWVGAAWSGLEKPEQGVGLYGDKWRPDPMHEYWDPQNFHRPETERMVGEFQAAECVECHAAVTPGIVKEWRTSRHATPSQGTVVGCDGCHGNDHQTLVFPTPSTCGKCHQKQHDALLDERTYGFPSHALAMERAVDSVHFVDKPKSEVTACLQCHSVATKCDSCHTRHRFNAAEARRSEACITCHSGPPHPDDESYFSSAHGQLYLAEGADWDWSKPLSKGHYKTPTCAYCHMHDGHHQVADKSIHKFGIREVNPATSENRIKRQRWLVVCRDCHPPEKAKLWLQGLDQERRTTWKKLYKAEGLLKKLRSEKLLYPSAAERPAYPLAWFSNLWPWERVGFYEGQASAFYNVSPIERDYFEMWYFNSLRSYKGAAHGALPMVQQGQEKLDAALQKLGQEAEVLRQLKQTKPQGVVDPKPIWMRGEYTDYNRGHN